MKCRFRTLLVVLSFVFMSCALRQHIAFAQDGHTHSSSNDLDSTRPAALSDESIFQLDSVWLDQSGRKTTLSGFRGKPTVLAMVYTSCQGACPIITADMQRIEMALPAPARDKAQFVIVSFDTRRDTPKALQHFAETHALDLKRWSLLTGSAASIRELAAVLGIKYKEDARGDFSHSNVITILDPEGLIRHQQVGLRQDPHMSVDTVTKGLKLRE